jgi:hypothetical protein
LSRENSSPPATLGDSHNTLLKALFQQISVPGTIEERLLRWGCEARRKLPAKTIDGTEEKEITITDKMAGNNGISAILFPRIFP